MPSAPCITALIIALAFGLTARASECSIRGSLEGFDLSLDQRSIENFSSLKAADALERRMIDQGFCTQAPPVDTCTVYLTRNQFAVYQGASLISKYWYPENAARLRQAMVDANVCFGRGTPEIENSK